MREEVDEAWKLLQHHRVDSRHFETLMIRYWLLVSLGEFDKALLLGQDLLHESEGALALLWEIDLAYVTRAYKRKREAITYLNTLSSSQMC